MHWWLTSHMLMHVPMDTYRKTWWSTSHLPTHRLPSSTTSLKYANQATKAHVPLVSSCGTPTRWAVSIRWTGLRTGLWDWTVGLDSQKVALIRFQSSTHTTTLQYAYITWTEFRADGHHSISISIGPDEVLAAISADVRAIQMCTCMQAK